VATGVAAILTAGVNYDAYDLVFTYTYNATRTTGSINGTTLAARTPWTNTGYFSQVQVNLAERLFLTGGLRAERNPNFGTDFGTAWSPRVGAAYVLGLGATSIKLRASYGESIRAPDPTQKNPIPFAGATYLANPNLGPERQRGGDGGVEIYLGRASLGVTYYNQRAIGLIQAAVIPTPAGTLITYQNQNVGRVKNEGWEFEAQLPLGPVQLSGTFSITNSTIQALAPGYPAGSYQVGDRIVGIPHTSAGATITYAPLAQTTFTATMTHFGTWINTDDIALRGYYYGGQPYRGSDRAYWMEYPAVTKFAVGVSQGLTKNLTAFLRAENVGNNLRFEQSNASFPTKPRSVLMGANVRY
jgi:outer membrane receptor protein involved in Fe transport